MDVCFYPACSFDTTPLKLLKGRIFEYIYADPLVNEANLQAHFYIEGYERTINQINIKEEFDIGKWEFISVQVINWVVS